MPARSDMDPPAEEAIDRLVGSLISRRSLIKRGAVGGGVLASGALYGALDAEAARARAWPRSRDATRAAGAR